MLPPRLLACRVTEPHSVRSVQLLLLAAFVIFLTSCGRSSTAASIPPPDRAASAAAPSREVRATGTVQAVHAFVVQTPYIAGQGGQLTLIHLVENGANVKEGDMLAEFDSAQQQDNA